MTYTVKYKLFGQKYFRKVKYVKGDLIAQDVSGNPRILILDDETRLEIPTNGTIFEFSKERFLVIKQNMEKESGQTIAINS